MDFLQRASDQAISLARGWFGREPRLSFLPFEQWKLGLEKSDAEASWGHIMRSSCVSIEKSRQRLGYAPRYTSLEAVQESVAALIARGRISVPKPEVTPVPA